MVELRILNVTVDCIVERLVVVEDVKVDQGFAKSARFVGNTVGLAVVPPQVYNK